TRYRPATIVPVGRISAGALGAGSGAALADRSAVSAGSASSRESPAALVSVGGEASTAGGESIAEPAPTFSSAAAVDVSAEAEGPPAVMFLSAGADGRSSAPALFS